MQRIEEFKQQRMSDTLQNPKSFHNNQNDNNNNNNNTTGDTGTTVDMKQPGIESPTLSYTTSSSSDGEFKTTRLGRILPADDDDVRKEVRREDEGRDEYAATALLQAVEAMTQLAGLDSEQYQQRLVTNSLPSTNHPSLSQLHQSIHRFQSTTTTLTTEYDRQTTEVVELQKQLNESRDLVAKLEKAVKKLHTRNTKLKERHKSEKSMARKLMEQVRQFRNKAARRKEEEEFYRLADKVQQHEQSLRERSDSNFSDYDSVVSSVSGQSLVTDDGIATVKIHRERTLTWPQLEDEEVETGGNTQPVLVHVEKPTPDALSPKVVDSNPFAKLLAPRPAQPYTLALLPPCSLQFAALHVEQTPTTNLGTEPPSVGETAFCVCGYHGFDTSVNVKPTIGARLLAINKVPVNPSWRTQDLEDELEALENTRHLTFRNDKWDDKQKELLNLAIQEQKRMHHPQRSEGGQFLRMRALSGDSPKNFLGFWGFHNNTASSAAPIKKQEHPKTPSETIQEPSPLDSGTSSLWKSHQTSSPKSESSFDDDLFEAGLAMPDVADDSRVEDILKINAQSNADHETEELKVASEEVNQDDSPLGSAFSSFWRSSKTPSPTSRDVAKPDEEELHIPDVVGSATDEGTRGAISSNDDVLQLKAAADVSRDRDSPLGGAFSAFWNGNSKKSSSKSQPDATNPESEAVGSSITAVASKIPEVDDTREVDGHKQADSENEDGHLKQIASEGPSSSNDGNAQKKGFAVFWKKTPSAKSDGSMGRDGKHTDGDGDAISDDVMQYEKNESSTSNTCEQETKARTTGSDTPEGDVSATGYKIVNNIEDSKSSEKSEASSKSNQSVMEKFFSFR